MPALLPAASRRASTSSSGSHGARAEALRARSLGNRAGGATQPLSCVLIFPGSHQPPYVQVSSVPLSLFGFLLRRAATRLPPAALFFPEVARHALHLALAAALSYTRGGGLTIAFVARMARCSPPAHTCPIALPRNQGRWSATTVELLFSPSQAAEGALWSVVAPLVVLLLQSDSLPEALPVRHAPLFCSRERRVLVSVSHIPWALRLAGGGGDLPAVPPAPARLPPAHLL